MRLLVLALILAGLVAESAQACSCLPPEDPREELADADAAVFGKVVGRRISGPGFGTARYRVRVLRDYKGNLGRTVAVRTSVSQGVCGLDLERGTRLGLLLYRGRRGYTSGLCSTRSRAHLEAGAEPLPEPDAAPPVRFLAAGDFGEPRLAALDAQGGLIGYGNGPGRVADVSVCPGGAVAVELVSELRRLRYGLSVRTIDGFAATAPDLLPGRFVQRAACLSEDGSRVAMLISRGGESRVAVRDGDSQRTLLRGRDNLGTGGLLAGGRGFIGRASVDLATGAVRRYPDLPRSALPIALSPDGTALAFRAGERLLVVDTETGRIVARRRKLAATAVWINDDRLAAGGYGGTGIFTRDLRPVASFAGGGGGVVVDGGELVTAGSRLERRDADGNRVGPSAELFSSAIALLAVVPASPSGNTRTACRAG